MALHDPLVGRRAELALLRDWLGAAADGLGRLVLLSAPAGLGKTRLIEEVVGSAGGIRVGWGAAEDVAGMPPLWPWTRAVRDMPGPREALATATMGGAGRDGTASAQDAAAALFAAYTAVLDALHSHAAGGLLLVLEDLHWADEASLRLLDRLAAVVRRLPLLVVATHRNVRHGPLAEVLPALLARPGTDSMRLAPLPPSEAAALLEQAADDTNPSAVRSVVERAGGSPLYLRTLARAAPHLLRDPATDPGATADVPELHDVVTGALHAAGAAAAEAVEAISVLGTEADLRIVAEMTGSASLDEVLARLERAVPAGLVEIVPTGEGRVRLAHALVRDAVYSALRPGRRAALHRLAAEVLERRIAPNDSRPAGEIARHWLRAGERGAAGRWAVRAAQVAADAGAHAQAADFLRLALESVDPSSATADSDRVELLLDVARADYLVGNLADSLAACERAAEEGLLIGDVVAAARAAVIVQGIAHPAANVRVEQLCLRALDALADSPDLTRLSQVEAQLANVLRDRGDRDGAMHWSDRAMDHAARSGDLGAELDAVCARGPLTLVPSLAHESLALGRRAIELAAPAGRPLAELWGRSWRADAHVGAADIAAAQAELAAIRALADRTQLPLVRWHLLRRQASWAALIGDFAQALARSEAANGVAESLQDDSAKGLHVALVMGLAVLRGDRTGVPDSTSPVYANAPPLPVVQASRVTAMLLAGHHDDARAAYAALPTHEVDPDDPISLPMVADLLELAIAFEDLPTCRHLAGVLARVHEHVPVAGSGTVLFVGSVARMRGRAELGARQVDAAVPLFEEGIRVDTMIGARPHVAQGRLGLATALAARGAPADLIRGRQLAQAAAADARRLDMPGVLTSADALLAAISSRLRAADPLSEREREVAGLVAHALTNRQIAERLVLSERTVEGHVRNILAKTGHSSRTELTRWLLQEQPR